MNAISETISKASTEVHIRMAQLSEPETMRVLLGEKATELTLLACPVNGSATTLPVLTSHTRMVHLSDPETMRAPLGEKAIKLTELVY
jgi:hypothetical protein